MAGTALLAASLTACSGGSDGGGDDKGKAEEKPKAPMAVAVNLTGDQVKAGQPVTVTVAEGKLAQVKVTDAKGAELPGKISDDGKTWTSERNARPPRNTRSRRRTPRARAPPRSSRPARPTR